MQNSRISPRSLRLRGIFSLKQAGALVTAYDYLLDVRFSDEISARAETWYKFRGGPIDANAARNCDREHSEGAASRARGNPSRLPRIPKPVPPSGNFLTPHI